MSDGTEALAFVEGDVKGRGCVAAELRGRLVMLEWDAARDAPRAFRGPDGRLDGDRGGADVLVRARPALRDREDARPLSGARRFPFYARILLAMAAGALLGLLAGPRAAPLGEAGKVIINLIKALAAPLLFFAIVDAFLRTTIHGRSAARMVGISLCNGVIALAIGLAISNLLRPGEASAALQRAAASGAPAAKPLEGLDFGRVVSGLVPTSVGAPFVENAILGIVVLGVLLGAALRRVKNEQTARGETGYRHVEDGVAALLRAFEVMLSWIIAIVPLAVFGVVAQTVGQHGFAPFAGLGPYVGVALLGLGLQVFVVYQAVARLRREGPAPLVLVRRARRRHLRRRRLEQPRDAARDAAVPRSDGSLAGVGAPRGLRRHEPEQRRHPPLRGHGRPLRGAGARHRA